MNNRELNEKEIEKLVEEVMPEVGRQHDAEIIRELKGMTHEDLDDLLKEIQKEPVDIEPHDPVFPEDVTGSTITPMAETTSSTETPVAGATDSTEIPVAGATDSTETPVAEAKPIRSISRKWAFLRIAAAIALLAVIILGIDKLNLGGTAQQKSHASLFETYYKEYNSGETFSARGKETNAQGKPNTAKIIQDASILINKKHSKRALHRGISRLEHLLTIDYMPQLEHEIHWYLGLAYLKDNRVSKAKEEFQKVIYLKSPHSEDAKYLLKKLK